MGWGNSDPYLRGRNYCVECYRCECDNPETDIIKGGRDKGRFPCNCRNKTTTGVLEESPRSCSRWQVPLPVKRRIAAYAAYKNLMATYLITFVYGILINKFSNTELESALIMERDILTSFVNIYLKQEYLQGQFGINYDLFGNVVSHYLDSEAVARKEEIAADLRNIYLSRILDAYNLYEATKNESALTEARQLYVRMYEEVCASYKISPKEPIHYI